MDCGEILYTMINNVLDASQISTQLFVPSKTSADPRFIIHKIINICKSSVLRKDLKLELTIDKRLPRFLLMDSGRFSQILMNLINNAIKFTDHGYIKIRVTWEPDISSTPESYLRGPPVVEYTQSKLGDNYLVILPTNMSSNWLNDCKSFDVEEDTELNDDTQILCEYWHERKGKLILNVEDTGIGILQENIEKLFKPFHQADSSIRTSFGGSGLGLWISKSIAKLLGGDITVKSKINKGSTFTLCMPCDVYVDSAEDKTSKQNYDFTNFRVLLVDHKQVTARTNTEMLQNLNTQTVTTNSSQEAIEIFKKGKEGYFQVILISMYLPNINGISLCTILREIEKYNGYKKPTPIFMLISETMKERGINIPCEANGYFMNPLRQKEVSSVFRSVYKQSKLNSNKKVLVVEDDQFISSIVSKMLVTESIPYLIVNSGKEALDTYKLMYNQIGILLLDVNLGDISGYDVAQEIRNFENLKNTPRVPIVCISAYSSIKHQTSCKKSGINLISKL